MKLDGKLVKDEAFDSGDEFFRLWTLRRTGHGLLTRYQVTHRIEDIDEAIHLLSEATSLSRTGSPSFTRTSSYGGLALLMRYEVNRENRDLDLAHTVLQYAVANHENCIPSLLAQSGMGIVRACNYQFAAGQGIKRLEEGIEIFQFVLAREAEELDESMRGAGDGSFR